MQADEPSDTEPVRDTSVEGQLMRTSLEAALFGGDTPPVRIGRFVVIDRLGRGGMGVVFRAFDPELGRTVAVKVLARDRQHLGERMRREAQTLARVNHPNIVTVHEAGVHEGRNYVAMELVVGGTLVDWCAKDPPGTRRRFERLLDLAIAAARGLVAAHAAGLVHRDLKPANMLVDEQGRLRIADFGLAREAERLDEEVAPLSVDDARAQLTGTGDIVGTPAYMAPEQLDGRSDARSDQWSLCATFWEAAFGSRPYAGALTARCEGPPAMPRGRAEVPQWFRDVLVRGLAPDPSARYPDVAALLADIERGRSRRQRAIRWIGAAAIAGSLAWGAWPGDDSSPCDATEAGLVGVWDDDVASAVRAIRTKTPTQHDSIQRLVDRFDTYAERWRGGTREVCERARDRGELQEGDVLEHASRPMACFRDARAQMQAVVQAMLAEDSVDDVLLLGHVLPPIARCEDAGAGPAEDEGQGRDAALALADAAVAVARREYTAASTRLDDVRPVLEALDRPGLLARLNITEARIAHGRGDYEAHFAAASRALAAAERAGDPADVAFVWCFLIDGAAALGRLEQADFFVERALSMARAAGDPAWLIAAIDGSRSRLEQQRGDHDLAYELGSKQLEWLETYGEDELLYAWFASNVAQAAIDAGRPADAAALAQRSVDAYVRALGEDHVHTGRACALLARMLTAAGDFVAAEPLAARGARVVGSARDVAMQDVVIARLGFIEVLGALGRFAEAREQADIALRDASATLAPEHMLVLLLRGAAANLDLEDARYDAAIAELGEIRSLLADNHEPFAAENRVSTCINLAVAHARAGNVDTSLDVAAECQGHLAALESDPVAHRGGAMRYLGEVYRRAGRIDDARAAYLESITLLDRLGIAAAETAEAHLGYAELLHAQGELANARKELALADAAAKTAPPRLRARIDALRPRLAG